MTDVEPIRNSDHSGWIDKGPRNIERDRQNPDILVPPTTDHGTLPNMRFSFSDAHQRLEEGGWTREVTNRELPASHDLAGVDMCLKPGAYRELHWHKEAEWAFMIAGNARVTALDEQGRSFIDDIQAGDLWDFEAGLPHSIQALDQGCEFLLVFSEPDFSENNTFLLTDWLAHTPKDVVAANFKTTQDALTSLPGKEKYIFSGDVPGSLESVKRPNKNGDMPVPLTLHMASVKPKQFEAGKVWIIDSTCSQQRRPFRPQSLKYNLAGCANFTGIQNLKSGTTTCRGRPKLASSIRLAWPERIIFRRVMWGLSH